MWDLESERTAVVKGKKVGRRIVIKRREQGETCCLLEMVKAVWQRLEQISSCRFHPQHPWTLLIMVDIDTLLQSAITLVAQALTWLWLVRHAWKEREKKMKFMMK